MSENETEVIVSEGVQAFELAQRKAKMYSLSTLVPVTYQGEGNVANVMIACNMAQRMQCDPLQVMQSLHVIHGRPSFSAAFLIARWNTDGRWTALNYEFNEDRTACKAWAKSRETGERVEGTQITLEMAKAEGWLDKKGSKWQTMPEQMLRYRAATFLIRSHAPELMLGMYERTEVEDVYGEQN
jgi:hypothetical protein